MRCCSSSMFTARVITMTWNALYIIRQMQLHTSSNMCWFQMPNWLISIRPLPSLPPELQNCQIWWCTQVESFQKQSSPMGKFCYVALPTVRQLAALLIRDLSFSSLIVRPSMERRYNMKHFLRMEISMLMPDFLLLTSGESWDEHRTFQPLHYRCCVLISHTCRRLRGISMRDKPSVISHVLFHRRVLVLFCLNHIWQFHLHIRRNHVSTWLNMSIWRQHNQPRVKQREWQLCLKRLVPAVARSQYVQWVSLQRSLYPDLYCRSFFVVPMQLNSSASKH